MAVITSIKVYPNSRMNINYREIGGKKLFLQIQSTNIVYPIMEDMIVVPITKKIAIITSIKIYPTSRVTINCKENAGKKSFSCKYKALI